MRKILFLALGICGLLLLTARVGGAPEEGAADPTAGATYLGANACKKCHIKEHRTWKKMAHANAFENLPEKYHGEKNDEGQACISCHVTGYGQGDRGGFVDLATSGELTGVQCEACHGPGSKHRDAGQKVLNEKRKSFNEGEATFIVKKTTNCSNCHNPHIGYKKKYGEGGE